MSSASPGATHRKPTRGTGRKAPTLRPDSNKSVKAGVRVVTPVLDSLYHPVLWDGGGSP